MLDISVVILNWNNKDVIRECLSSLFNELKGINSEVIVVDNGSTDGSLEIIKQKFPTVKLVENKTNLGFAKGVNQGISDASGEYILLLGSDTELKKDSVKILMRRLQDLGNEYAAVAPQLLNRDETIQSSCREFPTPVKFIADATFLWGVFPNSKFFGGYRMTYWHHDDERDVVQPQMTALLVRKKIFNEVGLLDENFPVWFNDVDWSYRVYKSGYKVRFIPESKVVHLYGVSGKKFGRAKRKIWRDGLLKYYEKWYPSFANLPFRVILKYASLLWLLQR